MAKLPQLKVRSKTGPAIGVAKELNEASRGELNDDQFEFVMAMDTFRRVNRCPFPAITDYLYVLKQLGYVKVNA